ncbi:hypothetical protein BH23PLA1_BH23PLA1_11020 [soil metagenome]
MAGDYSIGTGHLSLRFISDSYVTPELDPHLLLIDVHRRPIGFSFADRMASELNLEPSPLPTPCAVSYRVGEPAATGGRLLALWRRSLTPASALPSLPLPLSVDLAIPVDLERTYATAAAEAYRT